VSALKVAEDLVWVSEMRHPINFDAQLRARDEDVEVLVAVPMLELQLDTLFS
jgi:hypothetical protein